MGLGGLRRVLGEVESDPGELAAAEVARLLAGAEGLRRLVELARREDDAMTMAHQPALAEQPVSSVGGRSAPDMELA